MQEVALAAVRQGAPLRDSEKAAPWLYRLVVRQVLLCRRRHGRQRKLVTRYALKQEANDSDDFCRSPLDWLLADERRQQVRQALERLPQRDSEIPLLKYTENWTYREISRHLGVSQSAVEARLHRARKRLRSELAVFEIAEVTR